MPRPATSSSATETRRGGTAAASSIPRAPSTVATAPGAPAVFIAWRSRAVLCSSLSRGAASPGNRASRSAGKGSFHLSFSSRLRPFLFADLSSSTFLCQKTAEPLLNGLDQLLACAQALENSPVLRAGDSQVASEEVSLRFSPSNIFFVFGFSLSIASAF